MSFGPELSYPKSPSRLSVPDPPYPEVPLVTSFPCPQYTHTPGEPQTLALAHFTASRMHSHRGAVTLHPPFVRPQPRSAMQSQKEELAQDLS